MIHDEYSRANLSNRDLTYKTHVALIIRGLRGFFGLNQDQMAKKSGVSRPTLSRLEKLSGVEKARLETLDRVLYSFRELGADVDFDEGGVSIRISSEAFTTAQENIAKQQKKGNGTKGKKKVTTNRDTKSKNDG